MIPLHTSLVAPGPRIKFPLVTTTNQHSDANTRNRGTRKPTWITIFGKSMTNDPHAWKVQDAFHLLVKPTSKIGVALKHKGKFRFTSYEGALPLKTK